MLSIVIFIVFLYFCSSLKILSGSQLHYLSSSLNDPYISESMKGKIHYILFERFTPIVRSLTYSFSKKHFRKCYHIPTSELEMYGFIGLYHAIRKYNSTSYFYRYASIYINGSLYTCITKLHPITKVSQKYRRKKKNKNLLQPEINRDNINKYIGKTTYLKSENDDPFTIREKYYYFENVWLYINNLPTTEKKILHYKFDYYFNVIRSNKHISELMCCSEESIRKYIHKNIMHIVYNNGSIS